MFQPLSWCRLLPLVVDGIVAPKAVPILSLCRGQNKVPRHVPILIPDACDTVTLHFAYTITLGTLSWETMFGCVGFQCHHKHPSGKEAGRPIGSEVTGLCSVTLRSRHPCSRLWKLTPS